MVPEEGTEEGALITIQSRDELNDITADHFPIIMGELSFSCHPLDIDHCSVTLDLLSISTGFE